MDIPGGERTAARQLRCTACATCSSNPPLVAAASVCALLPRRRRGHLCHEAAGVGLRCVCAHTIGPQGEYFAMAGVPTSGTPFLSEVPLVRPITTPVPPQTRARVGQDEAGQLPY